MDGNLRPVPGHPRDDVVEAASRELVEFYNGWRARHGLTACEFLYIWGVIQHRTVNALCLAEREQIAKTPNRGNSG